MGAKIIDVVNNVFSVSADILQITRDRITEAKSISEDFEYFGRFEGEMLHIKSKVQNLPEKWRNVLWQMLYDSLPAERTPCAAVLSEYIANCPVQFIEYFNRKFPSLDKVIGLTQEEMGPYYAEWRLSFSGVLHNANILATKIIQLILTHQIDLELIYKTTGKDLRHLVGDSPSVSTAQQPEPVTKKRKSTFTLAQRVLLFKHVFGEMGICEKEDGTTNLAQLARLIHEMIGEDSRDVNLDNSNVYKALKKLNKQADADNDKLVKELTQLEFSDLAEKLK